VIEPDAAPIQGKLSLAEFRIELFGAQRCSFESNFPVDKMGTGYATLWNAFKRITAGCSPSEKLALYSGTAKRLYRLG
jgi:predicted TIM-barrel fold metal-dependent hydrolase